MAGRNSLLTQELISKICKYISAGAWDYVAAEAVGIGQSTFYRWLQEGEADEPDPLKREFWESVTEARAKARVSAELRVHHEKPDKWLLQGPGREKAGRPGWTNEATLTGALDTRHTIEVVFTDDNNDSSN
ncbi:MAG: hypothetical protein R2932_00845 [Caldilineaceae bacterium]